MNVQQQLTTVMEWLTATTMKVPLPASVGIATLVMEYWTVILLVSGMSFEGL